MNLVPKPVLIGSYWKGVGTQIHIRVRVGGEFHYTSRILKKGQKLIDLVLETRREFRRVA